MDISRYIHKAELDLPEAEQQLRLEDYCRRREHLSVWTSDGFREFLLAALAWNKVMASPRYEITGDENQFEYFGVWLKQ